MRISGRTFLGAAALLVSAAALSAQTPFDVFFNADKLSAMIAKAKNERKPDQGNFVQPLWAFPPYHASLEYRVHGIDTPPNVHEQDKEIIYVVQGACKLTMGGHLRNEHRTNAANRQGTAVDGGTSQRISKGAWLVVPENTPHSFTEIEDTFVIISLHVPKDGAAK
jgi:mannose-6-phosphate isomerase-like protein (cupin superfamily)